MWLHLTSVSLPVNSLQVQFCRGKRNAWQAGLKPVKLNSAWNILPHQIAIAVSHFWNCPFNLNAPMYNQDMVFVSAREVMQMMVCLAIEILKITEMKPASMMKRWAGSELRLSSIKPPTIQGVSRLCSVPARALQRRSCAGWAQCSLCYIRGINRGFSKMWIHTRRFISRFQSLDHNFINPRNESSDDTDTGSLDHVLLKNEYRKSAHSCGKNILPLNGLIYKVPI